MEVGEGLSVGLGNHGEDEEGVEGGDGGKAEEDSVRTKQRHEWFSQLDGESVLIFELCQLAPRYLNCNEDKCKLGGDQGARDEGR